MAPSLAIESSMKSLNVRGVCRSHAAVKAVKKTTAPAARTADLSPASMRVAMGSTRCSIRRHADAGTLRKSSGAGYRAVHSFTDAKRSRPDMSKLRDGHRLAVVVDDEPQAARPIAHE